MKLLIKQLLRVALNEAEYNYHFSHSTMPLGDNPEPYGSDNIFIMQGRDTGHFGSGVYFSTYTCGEERDYDNKYGQYGSERIVNNPNLMNVRNNLYRVDFDIYRNLYRVTNRNHGDILFQTLKLSNQIFYAFNYGYKETKKIPDWLGNRYILLENNFSKLGLNLPKYKEFIQMLIKADNDYNVFSWDGKKEDRKNALRSSFSSFSTRLMEYNDYNGVNVSNVKGYDNTLHGSVIYDMSKVDGEPKPIKNVSMFCKIKNGAAGEDYSGNKYADIKFKLLSNKPLTYMDFELINDMDKKDQLTIFKRYNKFIPEYSLGYLNDYSKSIYFKTLENKIVKGVMDEELTPKIIETIIKNGYGNIIYNENIRFHNNTLLGYVLSMLWRFDDKDIENILMNIPRALNEDEIYYLNEFYKENETYYPNLKKYFDKYLSDSN